MSIEAQSSHAQTRRSQPANHATLCDPEVGFGGPVDATILGGQVYAPEETHKSLNGNNLAMPPRTTNTATAKFTMRLLIHELALYTSPTAPVSFNGGSQKLLPSSGAAPVCAAVATAVTHKISEKSMAWESLARCGNRTLTTCCAETRGRRDADEMGKDVAFFARGFLVLRKWTCCDETLRTTRPQGQASSR